ncbi:unnamed protein product [Cladocopium goreaui]|uniref:Cytochrome P450 n=1 Tax=Cladocopium goreaui TaxID=2562237 RepID=A0A9P1CLZ4_9DINO|nr:unnamed protein product [Cladocopium goreaui]
MPKVAGVDVPNWCVAGAAVLTPAAIYAYLLRMSRQRRAFFADTPQPKETSAIFGGLATLMEINEPEKAIPKAKQLFKELGLTWGVRLPFPKTEFFFQTCDPTIIAEIQSKKDIFHSRPGDMLFDNTIPLGLLALRSEGPQSQWAFHRRLVAPLFSDKFLLGYSGQIQEKADLLRFILNERIKDTKSSEAECDIQHCLKLATLDVIGSIGFGFNSNALMTYLPEGHPRALSKAEAANELKFVEATEILMSETQRRSSEPLILKYLPRRFMCWRKAKGDMDKLVNDVWSSGK